MRFLSGLTAVFLVFAASVAAQEIDYAGARKKVKLTGQPLLIFVNTPVRTVKGFVSVNVETLPGYPAKCIVVGDGKLDWLATFAHVATDSDLREAVKPAAIPFGSGPASNVGRDGKPFASVDALDEVNRLRAERRLHPYQRDEGLTLAAFNAAMFRASHGIRGHTRNDFGFLPDGSDAQAAGCGALEPFWGFGACCVYERRWTHAGAASVVGNDGRIYHHIFVR